jgi:hypothetical protein
MIIALDLTELRHPKLPVLELARWLAASSKGAYFNLNVRGRLLDSRKADGADTNQQRSAPV